MIFARFRESIRHRTAGTPIVEHLALLAGDSLVYLSGTVMIGLGQYVLLPLYIRHLTMAEFGVYALIEITILVIVTVSQLGLQVSYLKWFADLPETDRPALLSTASLMAITAGVANGVLFALVVATPAGGNWFHAADRGFAWTLAPIVALESLQGVLFADLRARRRAVLFSTASFVRLIVMAGATVWFVPVRGLGLYGILLGRLVGNAAGIAVLLPSMMRTFRPVFAVHIAAPITRYGTPIIWSALIGVMMDASGRYFLSYYGMIEEVGIYAVGIKLANILGLVFMRPFGTAWSSISFQVYHRRDAPLLYTKLLAYAFVAAMGIASLIMLAGPLLIALLATYAYLPALRILPLLILPPAFRILEYWTTLPFYLTRRTWWLATMSTASVVLLVALNWYLVPMSGLFGASLSWVAAIVVAVVAGGCVGRRYYPLPLDWGSFAVGMSFWSFAAIYSSVTSAIGGLARILLTVGAALIILVGALYYFRRNLKLAHIVEREPSLSET